MHYWYIFALFAFIIGCSKNSKKSSLVGKRLIITSSVSKVDANFHQIVHALNIEILRYYRKMNTPLFKKLKWSKIMS